MKNRPIQHRLEYWLYWPIRSVLTLLPRQLSRRLGRALGALVGAVSFSRNRRALENLQEAMPQLSNREAKAIARGGFKNMGESLFDTLSSLKSPAHEVCRNWTLEGLEHPTACDARGQGTIFLSAHLGNWEIAAWALSLSGFPTLVVGRHPDNPHLLADMLNIRERFGNTSVSKHGAARPLLRELKAGGRVGLLLDQRVPPNEGIIVPFMGRPALTSPLVARLSLKTGAGVVALFGYHEPNGRYRIEFLPPIYPEVNPEDTDAVEALTLRYLHDLEMRIKLRPEQWLWMHRRWDMNFD